MSQRKRRESALQKPTSFCYTEKYQLFVLRLIWNLWIDSVGKIQSGVLYLLYIYTRNLGNQLTKKGRRKWDKREKDKENRRRRHRWRRTGIIIGEGRRTGEEYLKGAVFITTITRQKRTSSSKLLSEKTESDNFLFSVILISYPALINSSVCTIILYSFTCNTMPSYSF